MDYNTTAMELLAAGATIEANGGSASSALQVSPSHHDWLHDRSLTGLIKRGAIVTMMSGLGLLGLDGQVVLFEDDRGEYEILSSYPADDDGVTRALEDLEFYCEPCAAVA